MIHISIKNCRETFISYDAHNKQECVIKCPVDVIVADNNVVSLCCNHLGASAVKYCPRCHVSHFFIVSLFMVKMSLFLRVTRVIKLTVHVSMLLLLIIGYSHISLRVTDLHLVQPYFIIIDLFRNH